ncbi:MAG: guanine deaminase [Gammaproteobacteria bacterium]|nr:guanine deaminase [Gammaproteobacteria bacterium]
MTNAFVARGELLHCPAHPAAVGDDPPVEHVPDGYLLVRDGIIESSGDWRGRDDANFSDLPVHDYRGQLLVPGFIDCHIHYAQTDVMGAHGTELLEWLQRYTFPAESRFSDLESAAECAYFFIDELLRNGTTTALVFATTHEHSADAIFEAAAKKNLLLGAGKVLMDRNCPQNLRDDPDTAYEASHRLIERWHNRGRLQYAITPRFAPTSSEQQLARAGELAAAFPDCYVHTHLAENHDEIAWVKTLFPGARSYLDVYERFGLLRQRSVFAHCIHLDHDDRERLRATRASIAFCPTSNLFLGSGLFDWQAAGGIRTGLATDVGGGTSFNMLQTAAEAYKVIKMTGQTLSPASTLYLLTLGGAKALDLDRKIGNFLPGKEADFLVINREATPLLSRRMQKTEDIFEQWFALMMLADDRVIQTTFVDGRKVYARD